MHDATCVVRLCPALSISSPALAANFVVKIRFAVVTAQLNRLKRHGSIMKYSQASESSSAKKERMETAPAASHRSLEFSLLDAVRGLTTNMSMLRRMASEQYLLQMLVCVCERVWVCACAFVRTLSFVRLRSRMQQFHGGKSLSRESANAAAVRRLHKGISLLKIPCDEANRLEVHAWNFERSTAACLHYVMAVFFSWADVCSWPGNNLDFKIPFERKARPRLPTKSDPLLRDWTQTCTVQWG